jgi:hypothetical protein
MSPSSGRAGATSAGSDLIEEVALAGAGALPTSFNTIDGHRRPCVMQGASPVPIRKRRGPWP